MNEPQTTTRAERTLDRTEKAVAASDQTMIFIKWVCFILVIMVAALSIQNQFLNASLNDVNDHVDEVQVAAEETREAARETHQIALSVTEDTPEDQELSEAIATAVAIVPQLKQALCELLSPQECEQILGIQQ